MCLEHCFNRLPVKHGRDEEWREGFCGENPGKLKDEIERLRGIVDVLREALKATVDCLKATDPNEPISSIALVQIVTVLERVLADNICKAAKEERR